MELLILALFSFFSLATLISFFSFKTLLNWKEAHLKILNRGTDGSIWLFFFAALGLVFISFGLRFSGQCTARTRTDSLWFKIRHVALLLMVFGYTSIFFNPQANMSNAKSDGAISCPDGYAYKLENDRYIRCEDFNAYFEGRFNGEVRKDLWIQ